MAEFFFAWPTTKLGLTFGKSTLPPGLTRNTLLSFNFMDRT